MDNCFLIPWCHHYRLIWVNYPISIESSRYNMHKLRTSAELSFLYMQLTWNLCPHRKTLRYLWCPSSGPGQVFHKLLQNHLRSATPPAGQTGSYSSENAQTFHAFLLIVAFHHGCIILQKQLPQTQRKRHSRCCCLQKNGFGSASAFCHQIFSSS